MRRKQKNNKKNLLILLVLFGVVGIGIGYAALTQTLSISNSATYDAMKWNVGFSSATDNNGTIEAVPTISSDKKSISVSCDIGTSTSAETCIIKATVKNDSTFNVELGSEPKITYNSSYIDAVTTSISTGKNSVIKAGNYYDILITISTKELTADTIPTTATAIPITITLDWVESDAKIITFYAAGGTHYAVEGMTWQEFINSSFNTRGEYYVSYGTIWYSHYEVSASPSDVLYDGASYSYQDCCFDPGAQVLMADGTTKNIEDVRVGDMVMSLNEDTGEFIAQRVSGTIINPKSTDLVYVNLSNGVQIGMRAYHPLLTTEGYKTFRPNAPELKGEELELLEIGDTLVGYEENVTIVSVESREHIENYKTYNLSIEGYHNYIVNGVVVHNASCPA